MNGTHSGPHMGVSQIGYYYYGSNGTWQTTAPYSPGWHHFEIFYNVDSQRFTGFVNDTLMCVNVLTFDPINSVNTIRFATADTEGTGNDVYYIDDVILNNDSTLINILTPRDETYTEPMQGYYPGSYGFENDNIGSFPAGWSEEGDGSYQGRVYIVDSKEGHNRCMYLNDPGGGIHLYPRQYFSVPQTSGTVELWVFYNSHNYHTHITLWNSSGFHLVDIFSDFNVWKYDDGSSQVDTGLSSINQWFQFT